MMMTSMTRVNLSMVMKMNDALIRGYQNEIAIIGNEINRKQKQISVLKQKYEKLKKELAKLRSHKNE